MGYFTDLPFREMNRRDAEIYRTEVKRETSEALHRADLAMRGELDEYDCRAAATAKWQMLALQQAMMPALGTFHAARNDLLNNQLSMSANMRHAASFGQSPASMFGRGILG